MWLYAYCLPVGGQSCGERECGSTSPGRVPPTGPELGQRGTRSLVTETV